MPEKIDISSLSTADSGNNEGEEQKDSTGNWKQAIADFLTSKVGIFKTEAKEVAATVITKIALLSIAVFFLVIAWVLVNAGLAGFVAETTSWGWYHVLFAIAGGHLIVALVLVLISRKKGAEPFPVTRAELEKDREWLDRLKKH